MLLNEFIERGCKAEEYKVANYIYMFCELDKNMFCEIWSKLPENTKGLFVSAVNEARKNYAIIADLKGTAKALEDARKELEASKQEAENLKYELAMQDELIDRLFQDESNRDVLISRFGIKEYLMRKRALGLKATEKDLADFLDQI
jgi:hypothetical protein